MKRILSIIIIMIYTTQVFATKTQEAIEKNNLFDQFGVILEGSDIKSLGGHSGGGGELVAMEFVSMAYDIYIALSDKPIMMTGFNINDYLQAVRTTKVIGRTERLFDSRGEEVDALNFPELGIIIINEESWGEKSVSNEIKGQLVFHEYLGIMSKHDPSSIYYDENYQISSLLNKQEIPVAINDQRPSNGSSDDVDLIFVIDNSGSMGEHQIKLQTNIDILLSKFYPRNPRIGVLTSESYTQISTPTWGSANTNMNNIVTTTWGMSKHLGPFTYDSMNKLKYAITSVGTHGGYQEMFYGPVLHAFSDTNNASFFRKDAELIIIFLTDEAEQTEGMSSANFLSLLSQYRDLSKVSIYPLVSFPGVGCSPSTTPHERPKFEAIVKDPRIKNGKLYDICEESWLNFNF